MKMKNLYNNINTSNFNLPFYEGSIKNFYLFFNKKINVKAFSSTSINQADSEMMTKINDMVKKSEAFKKSSEDMSELIKNKNAFNDLKEQEWRKFREFTKKNFHYLNEEKGAEVDKLFDQGARMDKLLQEKIDNLDLSDVNEANKAIDLASLSYDSKYKIFSQIENIFKSTVNKKNQDGTISNPELDVFNILLGKRNQEKEIFYNYKNKYFQNIKERLYNPPTDEKDIDKPSKTIDKPSKTIDKPSKAIDKPSKAIEVKDSSIVSETKTSPLYDYTSHDSSFPQETLDNTISQEVLDVILSLIS
jgi:hypothetical protein